MSHTHCLVHFSVRQTCTERSPCTSPCAELFAFSPPSPSRSPILQGAGVQQQGSGWGMCAVKTTLDKSSGFCKLRDLRRFLTPEPVLLTWKYSLTRHKHRSIPLLFFRRDDVALGVRSQKSWLWIRRLPLVTCVTLGWTLHCLHLEFLLSLSAGCHGVSRPRKWV